MSENSAVTVSPKRTLRRGHLDVTSASCKGHEERITSAVSAADLYAKLGQMLFQRQGRQRPLSS
jgi:membrane-bound lytic murein transglycosylase MltF